MSVLNLVVALGDEMGLELFVGEDACLQEVIHVMADLHHDIAVDSNGGEVVVWYDGLGDKECLDTHVLQFLHGGSQVKNFNVSSGVSGAGGADFGVKVELDGGESSSGGGDITFVVNTTASYGKANSFWFCFLGSDCGYCTIVSCFLCFGLIALSIKNIMFVPCGHPSLIPCANLQNFLVVHTV